MESFEVLSLAREIEGGAGDEVHLNIRCFSYESVTAYQLEESRDMMNG